MFAEPQVIKQGNNLHVQHGDDSGLVVSFETVAIEDKEKSVIEGRPIYRDVDMISIRIIGDTKTHVMRPVQLKDTNNQPSDPVRFPRQWEAFKNKQKVVIEGTPITEWPPLTRSQAMNLKAMNIHTVEDLAQVSDANLSNVGMGTRALRDKAIRYLENAKNNSGTSILEDEVKQLKNKIKLLEAQSRKANKDVKDAS